MFKRKWKPSKTRAREFARKMDEIDDFCAEHGIRQSASSDSYYFSIRGQSYRVSNHTVAASNRSARDELGQIHHPVYHPEGEREDTIYITAGKTRIIEIYNDLFDGFELDRRGFRKD